METSIISLPENMETPLNSLPEDIGTLDSSLPENMKTLLSSLPEDIGTPDSSLNMGSLLSSLPEDIGTPESLLPENMGSSLSSLPEDIGTPESSLPENMGSSLSSLPEDIGTPKSSLRENMGFSLSSLPEDIGTPESSLPENMGSSLSSLPEDIGTPESSLPENMESFLSSLPENITIDERFLSFANRVAIKENMEPSVSPLPMVSSTIVNILSDINRVHSVLSYEDTFRLMRMQAVYMSNQGKLLASGGKNNQFFLVDPISNGFVPRHALFPAPYSNHLNRIALKPVDDDYVRGELSTQLSKYIWPLDQDVIHVQIRSTVSCYHRFCGNMKVVFTNNGRGCNGEYCLAACNCCGGIIWLPKSECRNRNHVWTLQLFDPPSEGEVHLSQRLRRKGAIADNNKVNVINNFGGNTNGEGAQTIGAINTRTEFYLRRE